MNFNVIRVGNYLKFYLPGVESHFTVSGGNTKVQFPIISFGSATNCVNKRWCPYSVHNPNRKGDAPRCYAQKSERMYPSVIKSRINNETFMQELKERDLLKDFGRTAAEEIWFRWRSPIVRFNESSDIEPMAIEVLLAMQETYHRMSTTGIEFMPNVPPKIYGYSRSKPKYIQTLRDNGIAVMHSDNDFLVIKNKGSLVVGEDNIVSEVEEESVYNASSNDYIGAYACKGTCSTKECTACISGENKVVVVKH